MIELDHNAGMAIDTDVLGVLSKAYIDFGSNPSSPHSGGAGAKAALEKARRSILTGLKAERSHVLVFTSGVTEGLNMALHGSRWGRLLVSATEHLSVLKLAERVRRAGETQVVSLGVDQDGILNRDALARELELGSGLVVVQSANGDTGVLQPLSDIAKLVGEHGSWLLVDGTQIAAWGCQELGELKSVIFVFGGRKLGGPHSIGALLLPRELVPTWQPLIIGGGQEFGLRAGTPAVPEAVALAAACSMALARNPATRVEAMRNHFERSLHATVSGVRFYGRRSSRLPNTSAFVVDGVNAERLQRDLPEVLFGRGAACGTGVSQRSHVLSAMGAPHSDVHDLIRISLGPKSTLSDIDCAVELFARGVDAQRG